jgi:hypothetical protein
LTARVALGVLLLASCGSAAPDRSDGAAAADAQCALDPTGVFVFHVHNAGTGTLVLALGCRASFPIALATPAGRLPISPGSADVCGFSCDEIYSGHVAPGACSDCGPGDFLSIAPGDTANVPWDRRVYLNHEVSASCAPSGQGTCALGVAVAPSATQAGALTTCPDDQHPTGSCLAPKVTEFTVDTTGADATIQAGA